MKFEAVKPLNAKHGGRSREGAWIEIPTKTAGANGRKTVAPARERGLKYFKTTPFNSGMSVAPARERGLK